MADDLTPVKPLPAPHKRLAWWLPLGFLLVALAMWLVAPFRTGFWGQLWL